MGLFGKLLVGIVGFYAGVYCDQNYKLPSVSEPAQLLDEVNKWLEEYKNSKSKGSSDETFGPITTMTAASSRPASGRRSPLSAFTSEETLEFLNEELNLLGIQTIDRLPTTASTTTTTKFRVGAGDDAVGVDESVEQLLRTLFHLVDLQRRNVVAINDLETDKRTSRSEKERLSRQLQQLQQQQAAMKQTTAQAKEKERRAEVKAKELTKMLNAERDEKKKLFQAMQYKEKQFVHESRKNEREMSRLKEHLQQMDKGDNILIPPKIEVVNDLKRPGGRRRSTWSNLSSSLTKEEEALYSVVVANFGERQKQLLAENTSLRQSLAHLKRRVEDVLGGNVERRIEGVARVTTMLGEEEEGDPALRLPLRLLNLNDVEQKLDRINDISNRKSTDVSQSPPTKSHLHIADDKVDRCDAEKTTMKTNSVESAERERLTAKLEYYEETIERQAKMIERLAVGGSLTSSSSASSSSASSSTASSSFLSVASSSFAAPVEDHQKEAMNLSMEDIRREREALMREKKEVADEALNLAKERLRLREAHYRLISPLDQRNVGDQHQSVQNTIADHPKSSTNSLVNESLIDVAKDRKNRKPSLCTDDHLLADYLVESSENLLFKNSFVGDARKTVAETERMTAVPPAVTGAAAATSAASTASALVEAPTSSLSGRSTIMTSLTSISRLNTTAESGDDVGAFV